MLDYTQMDIVKILFLAADPSDAVRLRLLQELRDIREKLQLAKYRDSFLLESRESVRPGDISQAIFDVEPQIIHFSGHGTNNGALCFEDVVGKTQLVQPDALADLFGLVAEQVNCVILNACYSEVQAKAIVEHIPFVVGMNQAIGDKAAITFAIGFYKALGAGRSFEDAYKFACVEIKLASIPEHLTPVLHIRNVARSDKNKQTKYVVILSATIDEIDKPLVEAIVAHLRQVSGDTSLTLQEIKAGSVKLVLRGSREGFKRLRFLFKTGKLNEILGITVQSVRMDNFFHFLANLFDAMIEWLGEEVTSFLQKLIDKLQSIWETQIRTALLTAFGDTSVLYIIFYAGEAIGETIMEIWDPRYYDSKPSQVFQLKQYPIDNPLPKRRQDARVLMLENWA